MKITDKQLAVWINNQRRRRELLDPRRRKILEEIPGWSWDPLEEAWERGFDNLKKYGFSSHRFVTPDGYKLGQWIQSQISKRDTMTTERRKRLESIPSWTWNALDEKWEKGFNNLKKYGTDIPQLFITPDGHALGRWVTFQRQKCSDPERRKRLESIPGWTWNTREAAWEKGFSYLKKYGTGVNNNFVTPDGYKLGQWISVQRRRKQTPENRKKLESVPGWSWNVIEVAWEKGFNNLKKYGIVPDSFKTPDGHSLGLWIANNRQKCKDPEKRKKLESVRGWYWSPNNVKARRK